MLLGDQRKKNVTQKIIFILPLALLPMVFMFISFLMFNDSRILIVIAIVYFIIATSMALFIINIMKNEQTALKGLKVKVISLEYKLDLDNDKKNTKKQFYSKEYYKNNSTQTDLIPLLESIDEDEVYEIVIITAYYYCVIKNQFGQSFLVHTNNLKLLE